MLTAFLYNLVRNYVKDVLVKAKRNAVFSIDFSGLYPLLSIS